MSEIAPSPGERSVQIRGDATGTVIVTGDSNQINLTRHPQDGPFFHLVDAAFRARQQGRQPADFYNGTRPNWANIAAEHDAPRDLLNKILEFVRQPPAQRLGLILGPAGEGKTTLLMRVAWELSRQGYAVLWRHYGHVEGKYALPLEAGKPLVLCFDDLAQENELPALLRDLAESGLPFVVLGSARQMDWAGLEWSGQVTRLAAAQKFPLAHLQEGEACALLGKLEMAGALGALQAMTPEERLQYLLTEASAHQLLPALLTIRCGTHTEADLDSLRQKIPTSGEGKILQSGKYNVCIDDGDNIRMGDQSPLVKRSVPPVIISCPFIAGPKITDPRYFVGRKEELRRLVRAMEGVQPVSQNVVGERRIGKSSLLYHLYQTWEQRVSTPHRYVVIYLSLQDAATQREMDFYRIVARELLDRPAVQRVPALVSTLNQTPLQCAIFADAMREFQKQQLLPVLCLDEFEALFQHPEQFNDDFYNALRALMDENALMLVIASLKPLDVYRRQHHLTSSFFNLGHVLELGELTEEEANDLVRLPASTIPGAPAALSIEEQRLARRWGERHPYLLQLAGYFLFQARQEGRGVEWAREQFEKEKRRVSPPRFRLRTWLHPLRWIFWHMPARLGRLVRGVGSTVDEVANVMVGMVILILIVLIILGSVSGEQILDLLQQIFGGS